MEIKPDLPENFALPPGTDKVQFCRRLKQSDYEALARELRGRPEVALRVYHSGQTEFTDLDFLAHFPDVRNLSIELFWLENIDGFEAIRDLEGLTFGWTKRKSYSLRFLQRFGSLRQLYLEGHKKDVEVLTKLSGIQRLTLRSITLPSIGFLSDLPHLEHLEIKLGGTSNLQGLSNLRSLRYLELWLINGLSDLSVVADVTSLEHLFLQALRNVTNLPSFQNLRRLRIVYLETMKGLRDLSPIAKAPSLEKLQLVNMPNIDPKTLRCFAGHPNLREFFAGLGSFKRNAYAEALVGLPPTGWLTEGAREQAIFEIMKSAQRTVN